MSMCALPIWAFSHSSMEANIGALVYHLLDFSLRRYIGENASFIMGTIYIAFVLFIPYGIVGSWRTWSLQTHEGWQQFFKMLKLE